MSKYNTNTEGASWEILALARFLLAMVVLVSHLNDHTSTSYIRFYSYLGPFEAVLGFLLISGFSIGKSISSKKQNYFYRRIQRIYPIYLVSVILQILIDGFQFSWPQVYFLIANLLFLNQFLVNSSLVGPAWTLSLEVWLYILAPWLLKGKRNQLLVLVIISFVSFLIYKCGRSVFHWPYYTHNMYAVNLLTLSFIWIAGFIFAIYPKDRKRNAVVIAVLFILHLVITAGIQLLVQIKSHSIAQFWTKNLLHFSLPAVCLAFAYFPVVLNYKVDKLSGSVRKLFIFLGNISYPLYLTHTAVIKLLEKKNVVSPALMIFICILFASVVYLIFDIYSRKRTYHLSKVT